MLSDTFVVEALLNLSHGTVSQPTNDNKGGGAQATSQPEPSTPKAPPPITTSTSSNMQMRRAIDIVQRYHMRGKVLPHQSADRQNDPVLEQEHLDAQKLSKWRQSVKANKKMECSDAVRDFLDKEIVGWRDDVNSRKGMNRAVQIQKAREIVERYHQRGNELPRKLADRSHPDREQEYKDAQKLTKWKQTLKGNGNSKYNCPDEIRDYLDKEMPRWRDEVREKNCFPMQFAQDIVRRYHERGGVLPRQKIDHRKAIDVTQPSPDGDGVITTTVFRQATLEESQQEYKDARKLHKWRQTLKGNGNGHNCSDEIRDFLDRELVNWREPSRSKNGASTSTSTSSLKPASSTSNSSSISYGSGHNSRSSSKSRNDGNSSGSGGTDNGSSGGRDESAGNAARGECGSSVLSLPLTSSSSPTMESECSLMGRHVKEHGVIEAGAESGSEDEGNTTHSDRSSPAPSCTVPLPPSLSALREEEWVEGNLVTVKDDSGTRDGGRKRARSLSAEVAVPGGVSGGTKQQTKQFRA
mmetsp:Transcript_11410/g.18573  ORF Transcript_11410/g.18573 Transcript_11410/m.18573 type:complete len:524 (+) Transcript_11410:109-1680(+)